MCEDGTGGNSQQLIQVHPLTDSPTDLWEELIASAAQTAVTLQPNTKISQYTNTYSHLSLDTPVSDDKVRFVCISDTHLQLDDLFKRDLVPPGDVLIHAGDFTMTGSLAEVRDFAQNMKSLPHRIKIVVAGNHDRCLDERRGDWVSHYFNSSSSSSAVRKSNHCSSLAMQAREYIERSGCVYLEDRGCVVNGIKLWGSPWSPIYVIDDWAFQKRRGEGMLLVWNQIPTDTDVLITHGPPLGHGDLTKHGSRAGCVELLMTVQRRVKPRYHIFGHIHENYGVTSDGNTIFINAANCGSGWKIKNPPIVFDIPLLENSIKDYTIKWL